MLAIVCALLPVAASADRFGPPYMASVTADGTTVRTDPDDGAPQVGGLPRAATVVVVEQRDDWLRIPDGWLRAADVAERTDPWMAQANRATEVFAKPNLRSDIRRSADPDAVLLVTGVSPGVDGDGNVWWATTEGYVALNSLRQAEADIAREWRLPDATAAPAGWWGQARAANVRIAPSTDAPIMGEFKGGERIKVLATVEGQPFNDDPAWYRIDGGRFPGGFVHSRLVDRIDPPAATLAPAPEGRAMADQPWLVVDRRAHTLTVVRAGQATFSTYVAIGKAGRDTPEGSFPTFLKYLADRMTSGSVPDAPASYNLPNVPFAQYFKDDGSAIHGTYWHDGFGTDESQGCINVTWADSAYLFQLTLPQLTPDQYRAQAPPEVATPVIILH